MIPKFFRFISVFFICLIVTVASLSSSFAQEITLKLINGGLVISGELVRFNGSFYVVKSRDFGVITVDASKFICTSRGCPKTALITPPKSPKKIVSNDFGIHGSNTIGSQLMPALIENYAKSVKAKATRILGNDPEEMKLVLNKQDGTKLASIDLQSHGSGTSAKGLAKGAAQIGMSSRPIKPNEIQKLLKEGFNDIQGGGNENIVALDGLLVVVAPSNSVQSLRMEQIAGIFSGQITDWSQVGREKPGPINIYARNKQSGTYDTFKSLVLKPYNVKLSPNAKRFKSNANLSDATANDPNGIGFTGFAYKRNGKALAISTDCGITHEASLFEVKTEEYPLERRLYLYSNPKTLNSPIAKQLLIHSLSDKAANTISKIGFINQSIISMPFSKQGNRIAAALHVSGEDFNLDLVRDFTKEFANAQRLSVTFRFKTGSTQLSNKSHDDIKRFIRLIKSGKLKNKEIFLVGFSDSKGAFELNKDLAFKRALAIKFRIVTMTSGSVPQELLKLKTYGELFPVACNSHATGQAKNRRVEVWVR